MRERIFNIIPSKFKSSAVYKTVKKGQKSFRITQQLLQSIWIKTKRLNQNPLLILTIPANKEENYVVKCHITKEKI